MIQKKETESRNLWNVMCQPAFHVLCRKKFPLDDRSFTFADVEK